MINFECRTDNSHGYFCLNANCGTDLEIAITSDHNVPRLLIDGQLTRICVEHVNWEQINDLLKSLADGLVYKEAQAKQLDKLTAEVINKGAFRMLSLKSPDATIKVFLKVDEAIALSMAIGEILEVIK